MIIILQYNNDMLIKIPEYVATLMKKLNENGYECFVVGGAIRSILLNMPVNDYDLTTNALPEETKSVFQSYHTIDTGLQHGTVTIISNHIPVEITTYRKDAEYKDHRHPDEVIFTTTLQDDCARRDFTINAFCYSQNTGILDFFDGKQDLDNKIIRCIGNPKQRFEEDALRILRAIRFASQLNFSIEDHTSEAILAKKDTLSYVSMERIQEEFTKFLKGPGFLPLFYPYRKVFAVFLKELNNIKEDWDVLLQQLAVSNEDVYVRLAIILSCPAFYDPKSVLKQLKYANKEINTVMQMIDHRKAPISTRVEIRHLLNSLTISFETYLQYREAMDRKKYPASYALYHSIITNKDCYSLSQLSLNGKDMLALGYTGKAISENLQYLLNSVIEDKVANNKEELIAYLKKAAS